MSAHRSTNEPVRVAVANDYEVIVHGVAAMLRPHPQLEVVELVVDDRIDQPVDVVLFDVFGSGEAHTGGVTRILRQPHVGAVAVYTSNLDQRLIDVAMTAGAKGYLSKGLSGDDLAQAIFRIAQGETVIDRSPTGRADPKRPWPGRSFDLTEREAEVLALIVQGLENDVIAERLYISPNTLKTRIRNLYRKMGFENRVQAAVWGVKHGFDPDGPVRPDEKPSEHFEE